MEDNQNPLASAPPPEDPGFLFEKELHMKFNELRPTLVAPPGTPLETLAADPTFKQLFIIDRTVLSQETFEAGYVIWENCGRDLNKFFSQFTIKVSDQNSLILEPNEEMIANLKKPEDDTAKTDN